MLTLGRKKPILFKDLDLHSLLVEAYNKGQQELLYVVPFVAKVLESCAKNKVILPTLFYYFKTSLWWLYKYRFFFYYKIFNFVFKSHFKSSDCFDLRHNVVPLLPGCCVPDHRGLLLQSEVIRKSLLGWSLRSYVTLKFTIPQLWRTEFYSLFQCKNVQTILIFRQIT